MLEQIYVYLNYVLVYIFMKYLCKLPEEGDDVETCRN